MCKKQAEQSVRGVNPSGDDTADKKKRNLQRKDMISMYLEVHVLLMLTCSLITCSFSARWMMQNYLEGPCGSETSINTGKSAAETIHVQALLCRGAYAGRLL